MAWQDLTTLYRGQPWYGSSNLLKAANQGFKSNKGGLNLLQQWGGLTHDDLARLSGQYWTTDPKMAKSYGPKIRSMEVPLSDLDRFKRFEGRVQNIGSGKFKHAGNPPKAYLVPKSTLRNIPSGINIGHTASAAKNLNYPFKGLGDELRFLKAGWTTRAPDISDLKHLLGTSKHTFARSDLLPFLGKGAMTGLGYLTSLPGQAALMTIAPTHLGADDMPTGDAEQEYFDYYNQYGDSYGDLKIPGWRKRKMDKLATQKGIDQVGMQKQIQDAGGVGVGVAPRRITPIHAPHPDRGGRDFQPQRPTRPGGFTDPGKGSYGPWKAGGGLIDNPLPGRSRYM